LVRLLLAASGIEFEDVRINMEDWSALKPTTPLGLLLFLCILFQKPNFMNRKFEKEHYPIWKLAIPIEVLVTVTAAIDIDLISKYKLLILLSKFVQYRVLDMQLLKAIYLEETT
jgi:hypothetical protein